MAGETQGSLSRRFGVSVGQIGRIVRGESWQNSFDRTPDLEQSAKRLLALQEAVLAADAPAPSIPPSPLEGGDMPTVEGGLAALQEKAREFGAKK